MSVVNELIRSEQDGTLSFGNYLLDTKSKLSDFEHGGDMYKVKLIMRLQNSRKMVHLYTNLYPEQQLIIFKHLLME